MCMYMFIGNILNITKFSQLILKFQLSTEYVH